MAEDGRDVDESQTRACGQQPVGTGHEKAACTAPWSVNNYTARQRYGAQQPRGGFAGTQAAGGAVHTAFAAEPDEGGGAARQRRVRLASIGLRSQVPAEQMVSAEPVAASDLPLPS